MDMNFAQIDLKQEASPRERIYFGVILFLVLICFVRWLYVPKMEETKILKIEVKNHLMQIDTLKKFAQLRLPEVAAPAEQNIKTGTKFEKAIEESMKSQQQVVAEIVELLTSSNMLNGVALAGMNFASEVNKDAYSYVPLTIELNGRYTGVLNYLQHIEKFGKLITVDNLELMVKDNPAIVNAKINASIYVVGTTKSAAPVQPDGGQPPMPTQQ